MWLTNKNFAIGLLGDFHTILVSRMEPFLHQYLLNQFMRTGINSYFFCVFVFEYFQQIYRLLLKPIPVLKTFLLIVSICENTVSSVTSLFGK